MKKLMLITLALMALMISVPAAMARDANRDAMRQPWRDQVNLEKQQARIEGLSPFTMTTPVPDATKPGTTPKLRADSCSCGAVQDLVARSQGVSRLPLAAFLLRYRDVSVRTVDRSAAGSFNTDRKG